MSMRPSPLNPASDSEASHSATAFGEQPFLDQQEFAPSQRGLVARHAGVLDVLSVPRLLRQDRGSSASARPGILCRGWIVTKSAAYRTK